MQMTIAARTRECVSLGVSSQSTNSVISAGTSPASGAV